MNICICWFLRVVPQTVIGPFRLWRNIGVWFGLVWFGSVLSPLLHIAPFSICPEIIQFSFTIKIIKWYSNWENDWYANVVYGPDRKFICLYLFFTVSGWLCSHQRLNFVKKLSKLSRSATKPTAIKSFKINSLVKLGKRKNFNRSNHTHTHIQTVSTPTKSFSSEALQNQGTSVE